MTPQDHCTVVAPLAAGREAALRALLDGMNREPGLADPAHPVLPFGAFGQIHFARLVLIDDALQADLDALPDARTRPPRPRLPTALVLMIDCDGPARDCLADLVARAGDGLRQLFGHCAGFDPQGDAPADLLAWLLARARPAQAAYVNTLGRTVQQVHEEQALQAWLSARLPSGSRTEPLAAPDGARRLHAALQARARAAVQAGELRLTPEAPTPLAWQLRRWLHLLAVPAIGLLLGVLLWPLLLLALPVLLWLLRQREQADPEICPRPDPGLLRTLQALEDRDVTNQYTAIGPVKPGRFRGWLLAALLLAIDYSCRHLYTRGYLARVQTIHFARWVCLDARSRVLFISNYDGSHQGYMDDFINKVAWGLNLVFSNGVGWPRTRWLVLGGARREHRFKPYQRRHQVPTQVWFKAYPGLSLVDLARHQRIRDGLARTDLTEAEALAWLKLL
ncbi:hypothetical protein [Leptothrix discophora]|uniref:Peroxidase n=1 Tax=Leptothrix discophora TaxID=89 RepID=A0ABT9G4M6_LEPDI|nr:hypothetical protein [Leptothrix discophora]MDP4301435.1 hypothetical protein [Leptothrix discophora]